MISPLASDTDLVGAATGEQAVMASAPQSVAIMRIIGSKIHIDVFFELSAWMCHGTKTCATHQLCVLP